MLSNHDLTFWLGFCCFIGPFVAWSTCSFYYNFKVLPDIYKEHYNKISSDSELIAVRVEQVFPDTQGDVLVLYRHKDDKGCLRTINLSEGYLNKFGIKAGVWYWKNNYGWFLIPDNSIIN